MRTAKIYARLQSQRTGSKRHVRYLLDGHGVHGKAAKVWTKGIAKKFKENLPEFWSGIDKKWRESKKNGEIGANSKVMYMQALIALPNDITNNERHSLAKQILKMFPQKHPVTIVEHEQGESGVENKHFHIVFSYRKDSKKRGIGPIDYEFRNGFDTRLKELLKTQYEKYGFKIKENKKEHQITYKPQTLMRALLKKHGRDQMRNPAYLTAVVLPDLKRDAKEYKNADPVKYQAARKAVNWLTKEIAKAHEKELMPTDAVQPKSRQAARNEFTENAAFWLQPETPRAKLRYVIAAVRQNRPRQTLTAIPIHTYFQTLKTKEQLRIEASYHQELKAKDSDGSQGSALPMLRLLQVSNLQEPEKTLVEEFSEIMVTRQAGAEAYMRKIQPVSETASTVETGMYVPEDAFKTTVQNIEDTAEVAAVKKTRSRPKLSGMFGHRRAKR